MMRCHFVIRFKYAHVIFACHEKHKVTCIPSPELNIDPGAPKVPVCAHIIQDTANKDVKS